MVKRLRVLALSNLALAVAFLIPLAFGAVVEWESSGLRVSFPKNDQTPELLREAQSATDIAMLRRQVTGLIEMRQLDQQARSLDAHVINRLFGWLWTLAAACGSMLLANAVAMWWLIRKSSEVESAL